MHNFKVGDKVKWLGNGGVKYGNIERLFATYADILDGSCVNYVDLYPAEGFYPMPGEFLVNDGVRCKVLGLCGDIVFLSYREGSVEYWDTTARGVNYTRQELERNGWRIEGQEPKKKVYSMDEVAKALGVPVDQLEIKKG